MVMLANNSTFMTGVIVPDIPGADCLRPVMSAAELCRCSVSGTAMAKSTLYTVWRQGTPLKVCPVCFDRKLDRFKLKKVIVQKGCGVQDCVEIHAPYKCTKCKTLACQKHIALTGKLLCLNCAAEKNKIICEAQECFALGTFFCRFCKLNYCKGHMADAGTCIGCSIPQGY